MSYSADMQRAMVVMAKWATPVPWGYTYTVNGICDARGSYEKRMRGIPWTTRHEAALRVIGLSESERATIADQPVPLKCADIPDQPILDFLARHAGKWCTWGRPRNSGPPSVAAAMPDGTPERLQIRKMARLIERGLVDGCPCGCRGDYRLP